MSLVGHLHSSGRAALRRDHLFWHFPHYRGRDNTPYSIIRSRQWKLIKRYEGPTFELFNLADDLGERNNLASQKPAIVEKLDSALMAHLESVGAGLPRANPDYGTKK